MEQLALTYLVRKPGPTGDHDHTWLVKRADDQTVIGECWEVGFRKWQASWRGQLLHAGMGRRVSGNDPTTPQPYAMSLKEAHLDVDLAEQAHRLGQVPAPPSRESIVAGIFFSAGCIDHLLQGLQLI
jgi:hypothetical protein